MSETLPLTPRTPVLITGAAPATGGRQLRTGNNWSYQLGVAGTGAVTATATVEVSNDDSGTDWLTFGTMSASGTTRAVDGINGSACWKYHRAKIDTITGTNAVAVVTAAGV